MVHEAWYTAPTQVDYAPCESCVHDRDEPRCAQEALGLTAGWRLHRGRLAPMYGGVVGRRCPRYRRKVDGA